MKHTITITTDTSHDNNSGGKWLNCDTKNILPHLHDTPCLHKSCPLCNGTGRRKDGLGSCVHMISCTCPKCSPRC